MDNVAIISFLYRFLATGDSLRTMAFSYRIGHSTAVYIVRETCKALWDSLENDVLKKPDLETWKSIADGFWNACQFPNYVGAIDVKHVVIQSPSRSGCLFFNYKGTFSLVLLAVVDANLRFVLVDIGQYGRISDGGVFASSNFGKALLNETFRLPANTPLPHSPQNSIPLPYAFIGDKAFPLKPYLLKPYCGSNIPRWKAIFNYRLSSARRTVENAFGILAQRWRIYRRVIIGRPDNVVDYIKATVVLHNFLGVEFNDRRMTELPLPCGGLKPLTATFSNNSCRAAQAFRDAVCHFFLTPAGAVP